MAKVNILWPFVKSFEGGFVNDPRDKGGATNMGVTIATWRKQGYDKDGDGDIDVDDLKRITDADAKAIFRNNYWNRWKANDIKNQSIANLLVDWLWSSGIYGIKLPQKVLGVQTDGIVGPKTLAAINEAQNPKALFAELHKEREAYLLRLVEMQPSYMAFLRGWLRRLDAIQYGSLTLNTMPQEIVCF